MKKLFIYSILALAIAGCTKEKDLFKGDVNPNEVDAATIAENVKNVFGTTFDPNQDWKMIRHEEVTITANAEETDYFRTARVQVLTANPFIPTADARVLNDAPANAGQKVKLSLDVPNYLDTLYAACVSKEGYYRVTPFPVGTKEVRFPEAAASRQATRAEVAQPRIISEGRNSDNLNMLLKPNKSTNWNSNATREDQWENSGWNDKFYDIEATIQDVADFTNDERNELYNVLTGIMPENTNNSEKVLQSEYLINTANYFFADGSQKPITVTPVRCGADLLGWESLYYYYYDPAQVEGLTDEARALFLKSLPKFKLLECADALVGLDKGDTPEARVAYAKQYYTNWRNTTRRSRTYTLAYFGDGEPTMGTTGTYQFPKGYRIGLMFRVDSVPERPTLVSQTATPVKSAVNFYADSQLNNEANLYAKWYYGWNSAERKTMNNYLGLNKSRAAIFSANGKAYIGFEDLVDKDYNDVIFEVCGGVTLYDPTPDPEGNIYTMAWEDSRIGDYDMNDVVIKAERKDDTHVLFTLVCTGANDELYLRNINGQKLNTTTEVHAIFGQTGERTFINTLEDGESMDPVEELIQVPADFTFTDDSYLPYIYNKTKGYEVKLARQGEDPHGIIIPSDFFYPLEYKCIKLPYPQFNKWGEKKVDETDWYLHFDSKLIYSKALAPRADL